MKYRRALSLVLMCIFTVHLTLPSSAYGTRYVNPDVVVVHDREKNDQIEALLELRGQLELDFETNREAIADIDQQLQQLGVEKTSCIEIMGKLSEALPAIDIPSTNNVRWTSRRLVVTYRGQHFELQIYEAVASAPNSPLLDETLHVQKEAQGVRVAVTNAIKVVSARACGKLLDRVSEELCKTYPKLKIGVTIYELLQVTKDISDEAKKAMSTSDVIDNVRGSAYATVSTRMRCIFVKPYQTPDIGNQVLSYIGNAVTHDVTTTTHFWNFTETDAVAEHFTAKIGGTTYSPYYDDFSEAAKNHYNYRYGGVTNFNDQYYVTDITFEFYGQNITHRVKNIGINGELI